MGSANSDSSLEGGSTFQSVLENASGHSNNPGSGGGRDASSTRQTASSTASQQTGSAQGSRKASPEVEAGSKKSEAARVRDKAGKDAGTGTPADGPLQAPATTAQTPTVAGVLLPSIPTAQIGLNAGADGSIPNATTAGSSFPTLSPTSQGAVYETARPAELIPPTASSDGSAGVAGSPASSLAGATSEDAAQTLTNGNASAVGAQTGADAATGGSELGGAATLPLGNAGLTLPAANDSQQSLAIADTQTVPAAALAAGVVVKAGSSKGISGAEGVSPGRAVKPSSILDREDKHKTTLSGSAALPADSKTNGAPASLPASGDSPDNSPDSTRPDSQSPLTANLAMAPQGSLVANQSSSGTPGSPVESTGSHDPGSTASASQSSSNLPGGATATANLPAVNSAQLIQSVRHSEMRLGLQSDEFGSMAISTSLGRQVLSAQISTEHLELGRILAAHLPAMEQKLSTAYGLPAKVELNSGASFSPDTSSGQSQEGRQREGGREAMPRFSIPGSTDATTTLVPGSTGSYPVDTVGPGSIRLDIRV